MGSRLSGERAGRTGPFLGGADAIKNEVMDDSNVVCAMALVQLGLVIREHHVEDPMHGVFDAPVATDSLAGLSGRQET